MGTFHNILYQKYKIVKQFLNERQRRLYLGAEAKIIGYGGVSEVSRDTGVSRRLIAQGMKELKEKEFEIDKVRKEGGGRKRRVETDITLKKDLEELVEPVTRGDPESPLRW